MIVITASVDEYKIDYGNIISASSNSKDRTDMIMPSYGIISNDATLEIKVAEETLHIIHHIADNMDNVRVCLYIKDTITSAEEKISTKYVSAVNYDRAKKVATITMVDNLQKLQDIKIVKSEPSLINNPTDYGGDVDSEAELTTLPKKFLRYFTNYNVDTGKWEVNNGLVMSENTMAHLKNCVAALYYITQDNQWRHYDELAKALMLHIYADADGNTVIDYQEGA
jgi:hypothetical protein